MKANLPDGVATIDDEVRASGVGRCVRAEVDIATFQLFRFAIAVQGDHALPQVLDLLVNKVGETSVNVARRDAVDARKAAPFVGQRAGHMDAAGLGHIVGSLLLREVGNVS